MYRARSTLCTALALALAGMAPALAAPQTCGPLWDGRVADVIYDDTVIVWRPLVEHREMVLRISGPCEDIVRVFREGETPNFDIREIERIQDGQYTWELRRVPEIDKSVQGALAEARATGDDSIWWELWQRGYIPEGPYVDSESFTVINGSIVPQRFEEGQNADLTTNGAAHGPDGAPAAGRTAQSFGFAEAANTNGAEAGILATRGTVLTNGNGVIRNSLCVGFDCPNNPTYSDTTILMMENNTRIKFDDTSTISGFPNNDWEIQANSNSSGGGNYFAVNDCGNSSQGGCAEDPVFKIESGVRANALYVESDGDVGVGTANPVVRMHLVDGDTPALRLDQDGSSGFAPQVWDVAGNETSFFVRDATNGSTLPFRVFPGSPSNTLVINDSSGGRVGIGDVSPDATLDIEGNDGSTRVEVREFSGTSSPRTMLELINNGQVNLRVSPNSGTTQWEWQTATNSFTFTQLGSGGAEMTLNNSGEMTLRGSLTVCGGPSPTCSPTTSLPDFVFEPDYPLMALEELGDFVQREKHLPGVMSVDDVTAAGGINMTDLQLQLLRKVEELTLYTLNQESTIKQLQAKLAELEQADAPAQP